MGKDLKGKELGMGICQRKDKLYVGRFVSKKLGKTINFYDTKLSIVRKKMNDAKYEDEHGTFGNGQKITVNEWFDVWLENYKKDIVSDSTYKNYKNSYKKHLKPKIGHKLVSKCRSIDIQSILNDMYDNEYSYGSMNLVRITAHALFDGAVNNEFITKNPVNTTVKCKQREVEEARVLTVSEQNDFISYASKSMYFNAYALMLQTGMRSGEIGGLFWSDIDFETKTLYVNRTLLFSKEKGGAYFGKPKTKTSIRDIPLTDDAIELLKKQKIQKFKMRATSNSWDKTKEFEDLVFTTSNGKPVNHATFNNNIIRIVTNINVDRRALAEETKDYVEFKPMHAHTLRHSFATRCIENGMKPKTLQKILGHSQISTTMDLYVTVTDDEKRQEMQKISSCVKVV